MNEEKVKRILRHCQIMNVLVDVMGIEMQYDLAVTKFTDPRVNNHIRRLKESLEEIKKNLAYLVTAKDREFSLYGHATEVHRLFRYFGTMDSTQLSEIMDAYESYDKINPHVEIS